MPLFSTIWYFLKHWFGTPPKGKVFLITGASKGIGKALAFELAKQGRTVILVSRNQKLLNQVQQEITTKYNTNVYAMPFDVTTYDGYDELLINANKLAGPVDTII